MHIRVWEQRNKDVHGDDKNNSRTKDNLKQRKLQYEIRKLHQLKWKSRPEDESLFPHIDIFENRYWYIYTKRYFKSHKKAIANSVEQEQKIKIKRATTGKWSIAGWLRNKTFVHRRGEETTKKDKKNRVLYTAAAVSRQQ